MLNGFLLKSLKFNKGAALKKHNIKNLLNQYPTYYYTCVMHSVMNFIWINLDTQR